MPVFNEFGAMHHNPTAEVDHQIARLIRNHLEKLLADGESLVEVRATAQYLESSVYGVTAEIILREAMKIRKGKQFRFKVGDDVCASGQGVYVRGTHVRIVEQYIDGGFAYYKDDKGVVHRDKDLTDEVCYEQ